MVFYGVGIVFYGRVMFSFIGNAVWQNIIATGSFAVYLDMLLSLPRSRVMCALLVFIHQEVEGARPSLRRSEKHMSVNFLPSTVQSICMLSSS